MKFAVGIRDIDLRDDPKYFDVAVYHFKVNNTAKTTERKQIELVACDRDQWKDFGKGVENSFDYLEM